MKEKDWVEAAAKMQVDFEQARKQRDILLGVLSKCKFDSMNISISERQEIQKIVDRMKGSSV